MNILHISDIHYRNTYPGGSFYEDMLHNMSSPFGRMKEMIPSLLSKYSIDVICVTGDICDNGKKEDYQVLKEYFDHLSVPVFIALGNHDHKVAFNKAWNNTSSDEPYLKVNVVDGYQFISFDNSAFEHACGYVDEERLHWINNHLDSKSIVLMHHQFEDVPGIPGMKDSEELKKILIEKHPIAILNGHTHWCKKTYLEDIPIFTAPSVSFHATNEEDGSVIFFESIGYQVYCLKDNKIEEIQKDEKEGRQLAFFQG